MTDELSNSLRRFFDIPTVKPAKTPTDLYQFLDQSIPVTTRFSDENIAANAWQVATGQSQLHRLPSYRSRAQSLVTYGMTRPNHSQILKSDRFSAPTQIIKTTDENFMIEPNSVKNSTNPIPFEKMKSDIIESKLKLGLNEKQQNLVREYLNNDKYENWDTKQTIDPMTRRVLHKCDVIREHERKLDNQSKSNHVKRQWLLKKTHSKGIVGIDTPLFQTPAQTTFYADIIQKRQQKADAQRQILQQRRGVLNHHCHTNSGLLYHCPQEFQHNLPQQPLVQNKIHHKPLSLKQTTQRIFGGAMQNI